MSMSKKIRFAAVSCALALFLSGCGNSTAESPAQSALQTDSTAAATTEITESAGGEILPEPLGETITVSPLGEAEKLELSISPQYISNPNGGRLLIIDDDEQCRAALLDLNTSTYITADIEIDKTLSEEYEYGFSYEPLFISGYPALYNYMNGEIRLMDNELNVIDTINLNSDGLSYADGWDDNLLLLHSYGSDEYYVISAENGKLSQEKCSLNMGEDYIQHISFLNETQCVISVSDFDTFTDSFYLLDLSAGTRTALNIGENENVYSDGGIIYTCDYYDNEVTVFDPKTPAMKSSFSFPTDYWISGGIANDAMFICGDTEKEFVLSKIFLDTGSIIATLKIPVKERYSAVILRTAEYGGYVYIGGIFDGESMLLRWKPTPNAAETGWPALEKPDYSRLSRDIAKEIETNYGISVTYGKEAVRFFNDYAVVSETDRRSIYNALSALKQVFGKYPEGFLNELTSYKTVEVLLTGDILSSGQSRNSITTADAFTTSDINAETVVLDVGISAMNETIAHEFMHVAEDIMYDVAQANPDNSYELFSRWNMLNKPDFDYAYIYTYEDGTTIDDFSEYYGNYYYEGCGVDVDEIYFVDGYSTTFPSEDRARLFQKMLIQSDALPEYFKGENINNKAAYLCLCLRDCFRSLDNCTDIAWERGINIEHDLDWYRENYDWEAFAVG